ncbi:uncharacterized protein LOC123714090 isoform X1 [Pieris brassicae]|uniref:uncharacterized protein LOC123714090 isoform X1 n=1 Tax=Pieris brassicae TaxID=7116 RepID=UPI001E65F0A5|nr:uncharacterized protein LOC123714090 isoform X1 [Pieris brassicae]
MREDEPLLCPAPSTPRKPSRLKRTLRTLSSPFRSGSPFHIGSLKRTGSAKSSVSDGEIARDERTMRKKNKKPRSDVPASTSRSSDSSPVVKKKESKKLIKIDSTRSESTDLSRSETEPEPQTSNVAQITANYEQLPETPMEPILPNDEQSFETLLEQITQSNEQSSGAPTEKSSHNNDESFENLMKEITQSNDKFPETRFEPVTPLVEPASSTEMEPASPKNIRSSNTELEVELPESVTPEQIFSPIVVEHPVATRAFTKAAWQKRAPITEIQKPIEEPSPEGTMKRRIAFVSQFSMYQTEDHDDDDDEEEGKTGEVGSLEEAVALARSRLAAGASQPHSHDNVDAEEKGYAEANMPAYGDLIEPENKAGSDGPSHATSSTERREHLYKILVIGELGTGKTSIIKRYVHQFFSQHYRATIGVDFALKVLNWDANTIIRLQLWDIAGQERFGNMTRVYYKEAVGAFIVFDVSRVATFDAVVKWKNDLDTKVQLPDGSPIPCILLANKCDQQKEGIVNSPTKMDEYCREKGFAGWFETSAKENINIEEAARSLVNKILLNDKLLQNNDKDGERIALDHKIANGENSRDLGGNKSCAC